MILMNLVAWYTLIKHQFSLSGYWHAIGWTTEHRKWQKGKDCENCRRLKKLNLHPKNHLLFACRMKKKQRVRPSTRKRFLLFYRFSFLHLYFSEILRVSFVILITEEYDAYIIVSFVNATLVLSIGETVEEVTDSGFLGTTPTLSCSALGEDALVQVRCLIMQFVFNALRYLRLLVDHESVAINSAILYRVFASLSA